VGEGGAQWCQNDGSCQLSCHEAQTTGEQAASIQVVVEQTDGLIQPLQVPLWVEVQTVGGMDLVVV
jgi:hypothetical protein